MTKKQILILLLLTLIYIWYFYISWIYWVINLSISLFLYSIFLYIFYALYKKIKDKSFLFLSLENFNNFLNLFLQRVVTLFLLLIVLLWSFSYYNNEINPAKIPIYEISNWEKTVVFHGMSHIWTTDFYKKVAENIKSLKSIWYVLYFEWVKSGKKENNENFDKALWIKFDEKTYDSFSKLYGLVNQDNRLFLDLVNDKDYNIDISIDEIMSKYDYLKTQKQISNRQYSEPIDVNEIVSKELELLNEKELTLLRYVNKSFINFILKSENIQSTIQNNFANKELFEVILDERNKVIADKIINSSDDKIVATYWVLHFKWILEILKQNDIRWTIKKIDYLNPCK